MTAIDDDKIRRACADPGGIYKIPHSWMFEDWRHDKRRQKQGACICPVLARVRDEALGERDAEWQKHRAVILRDSQTDVAGLSEAADHATAEWHDSLERERLLKAEIERLTKERDDALGREAQLARVLGEAREDYVRQIERLKADAEGFRLAAKAAGDQVREDQREIDRLRLDLEALRKTGLELDEDRHQKIREVERLKAREAKLFQDVENVRGALNAALAANVSARLAAHEEGEG